ncbi:STAS domain-containing protein [Streptomyces sp. NPDC051976]|uniref:STAS domain-containing protein n=1 Tax=Streptomyces sp. NPDC051976 TaxID=3154947 RepID=UPI003434E7BA
MPDLSSLNIYRHDRGHRATITLAGELDLDAAPALRATVEGCLRKGIRTIDIDLTALDFCDVSGLNAFLAAAERTASRGASLRLHHPRPAVARLLELSDTGFLLRSAHAGSGRRPASDPMIAASPGLLAS